MKKLVIAEKPSVAEQLAAVIDHCKKSRDYYEGEHYIVSWAVGHLVGLAEPEEYDKKYKQWLLSYLPIIPKAFRLSVLEGAEERFGALKKLMASKDVDEIINACDAGREGELIFRNIYAQAGAKKPSSRLWLSSYTDESIRDGFRRLRPEAEYDDLGKAALARSEADWLVGINATRGLTRRNGSLVTVGRVQTPVLALVAKREKEVQAFVAEPYFEVEAEFKVLPQGEPTYTGQWHRGSDTRFIDEAAARVIVEKCSGHRGKIASIVQKESRMQIPYLYDLGLLQREANGLYGLSASRTLRAAQSLYEEKRALTYPRTDSKFLPVALRKEVMTVLGDLAGGEYDPYVKHVQREKWKMRPFVFNDAKVSDHYAIIPTGTRLDRSSLSHDESVVYDLVVRRFAEQFYPEAVLMLTRVETLIEGESFGSDGRVVKIPGWLEVAPRDAESKDLPDLKENLPVQAFRVENERKLTKAPPRFTDASIIAAMETAGKLVDDEELAEAMKERGLGTPATRAEIIEKLIRTGVVERKARSLVATRRGIDLIDLLEAIHLSDLVAPDLTGDWEMSLRKIERGLLGDVEFVHRIDEFTSQMIEKIKGYEAPTQIGVESTEPVGVCPICGSKVFERPSSYVCERHGRKKTDCKFSIPKVILQRPITREEALQLMNDKKTEMLDGFISRRGFKFSARLLLKPDNKLEWEFMSGSGDSAASEVIVNEEPLGRCPVCQSPVIETTEHYRCASADCHFQMKKVYSNKSIDRATARELLEKGKTDLIEDFVSKYNKPFSAYLKLGAKGRVEFEFLNKGPRSGRRGTGRTSGKSTAPVRELSSETAKTSVNETAGKKARTRSSKVSDKAAPIRPAKTPAKTTSRASKRKGGVS
ncbi:MAG: DNA topoisomerase 3 [Candidatus Cryosericum sp.]